MSIAKLTFFLQKLAMLLQLIDTVHMTFVHSLLSNIPDLIIHWIQVRAVRWPEVSTNEVQHFLL